MRHHYVPEFLLKAWAETSADEMIEAFRLDIPGFPSKRHSPKGSGYETDLYALTRDQVGRFDKQAVETDCLKHIDNEAARVLRKMLIGDLLKLTERERIDWATFLMSLIVRTPDNIKFLNSEAPKKLKAILDAKPEKYGAISEAAGPPTLSEFTEQVRPGLIENFGTLLIKDLTIDPELGNKILSMNWGCVSFSGQKDHLLLSDLPITLSEDIDHPDLIIVLPISPHMAFMATNTKRTVNVIQKSRQQRLMMLINKASLNQTKKRIYARNRSPYRFICNTMNEWNMHKNDAESD